MPTTSPNLIKSPEAQPTTMKILQQCSESKKAYNQIAKIEQSISVRETLINSPSIVQCGKKVLVIKEIIRIIEFFLEITGNKKVEVYQIQVLAGDLYEKFRNDALEDIIMMFKMIRTGDLGKLGFTDSFNEKLMLYVDLYLLHKSEVREKLINDQNRKRKAKDRDVQMTPEALAKFEELQRRIRVPIQQKAETFSIAKALKSVDAYLEELPTTCQKLSDSDLKYEILRTESSNKQAHEILLIEQARRKNPFKKSQEPRIKNKE